MSVSLFLPALVVGLIGAVIAIGVVGLFLAPLLPSLSRMSRSSFALAAKRRALRDVEPRVKTGPLNEVLDLLARTFEFARPSSRTLIDEITTHNLTVFGLMLSAAESRKFSPPHSAVIEELLVTRREALLAYAEESEKLLKKKKAGNLPGWGAKEFQKKLSEIESRIAANQRAIEEQLSEFRAFIGDTDSPRDLTYH